MKRLLWTDTFTGLEDIAVNETAPNPCPVEFMFHHRETEIKRCNKVLMFMETGRLVRRWAVCVWLRFRTIAGSTHRGGDEREPGQAERTACVDVGWERCREMLAN